MEPDVIRMYSSSPPPMEDGADEEDEEFGDFGTFSGVPSSISLTEFDTPTTFNQTQALTATSPPELLNNRGMVGLSHGSSGGPHSAELSMANGIMSSERTERKKVVTLDLSVSDTADCNGGGTEVLTNGFAAFDIQGSLSSQNSVHSHIKGSSTEEVGSIPIGSPEDDFADFAAFSNAEGHLSQTADEDLDSVTGGGSPEAACHDEHCNTEQGTTSEDSVRDTNRTGPSTSNSRRVPAETPDGLCSTDQVSQADVDCQQRDAASDAVCTNRPLTLNGVGVADRGESKDSADCSENDLSPDAAADNRAGRSEERGSGTETETETETETSFGRPLSTDALEEYGDMSTTGSVPSPPLQGETTTPADDSQLAEDDEDFGDFGDAGSFSGQGFGDFDHLDVQQDQSRSLPAQETESAEQDDDFGDFNSPRFHSSEKDGEDGGRVPSFPSTDSYGDFSAESGKVDAGWSAFGEQQEDGGESWAAFSTEPGVVPPADTRKDEEEEERPQSEAAAVTEESSRTPRQSAALSSRLEKLFQSSFPHAAAPHQEEEHQQEEEQVVSLKILLEPPSETQSGAEEEEQPPCHRSACGDVWMQLQDVHEAFGLRYQWGGSHCNKALLCCLGIDTRNILFTGQKKQPVIVPMYAASLGMLEPTKEPVKPVSAAEMIASIAQAPAAAAEKSSCSSDAVQEALPPIQFDWSSSGLTNPLDGVDPELYELTTSKLEPGSSSSRVADAFARLMSTMEKTSTSTRKPRKDENLSEEAAKVIAALPDLSFMQAKVLMFPATLTPLGSHATPD